MGDIVRTRRRRSVGGVLRRWKFGAHSFHGRHSENLEHRHRRAYTYIVRTRKLPCVGGVLRRWKLGAHSFRGRHSESLEHRHGFVQTEIFWTPRIDCVCSIFALIEKIRVGGFLFSRLLCYASFFLSLCSLSFRPLFLLPLFLVGLDSFQFASLWYIDLEQRHETNPQQGVSRMELCTGLRWAP